MTTPTATSERVLSMTTRVALGASLMRELAPHLHDLDLVGLSVYPSSRTARVRIQNVTLTGAADLIDRLRNNPSCIPDAGDGDLFATATHTHVMWECDWDGYRVEVCACEPLTSNDDNAPKEKAA